MEQTRKKQHYVPQCYLKAWRIEEEKHQVYTYDEQTDILRINNISDVASERYFYDMNLSDLYQDSPYKELFDKGIIKDHSSISIYEWFGMPWNRGFLPNIPFYCFDDGRWYISYTYEHS